MSYISTTVCPHQQRLLGFKEHGNRNYYNVFKHELTEANKYGTISIYVLKYSRGHRLTLITQGLSLSHLLWTANTEKETERWFTLPLASVSSAAMSAVQLPQPCCSVGLTAPHVLQALFSLTVETHGDCLKSFLNALKLSLALLTGRGPGLKCDISGKGGIPENELCVCCPTARGRSFQKSLYTTGCTGMRSPDWTHRLQGKLVLQEASADLPDLHRQCRRNPLGQI